MGIFRIWLLVLFLVATVSPFLHAMDGRSVLPENILKMSLEEMLNVKITTAGKKEQRVADSPASVVIITRKDIETYGYRSLEEILENVPGMYAIDDFAGYRKTYGVRGFYSGYPRNIIFLVNGISQAEGVFDYHVMSNFNIPVEAIDRIEVVRGPMSVIYGQGAFFGAINIITNDSDNETNLVSFSGGKSTKKAAAKISGSQGEFKFSASAGYSDSDGPDHDLSKMVSNMSSLTPWGINEINARTEKRLERESRNFIFSGRYKNFHADMSVNRSCDEIFIFKPSVTTGSPYDRTMTKIALGYENQLTDAVKINSRVGFHHFSFTLDWDIALSSFTGGRVGATHGKSDVFEFELDAFVDVSETLDLTTGIYYKIYDDTNIGGDLPIFDILTDDTASEMKLWALFAQVNYALTDKLRFVTGLRIEQLLDYSMVRDDHAGEETYSRMESKYAEDNISVIPSIAALYTFNDDNILKLLYGKAIARPSFFQVRDQIEEGFPDLETEEIQTFEINYITVPFSRVTLNFSLFHNILDNLIVRSVSLEGGDIIDYASNGGKLITNGGELSIQANPLNRLFADISLTYQETEDERAGFEDIEPGYSPHFLGYVKLSYAFDHDIILSFSGTYVDEMETEWDVTLNDNAGGRIGSKVDDYFILGANLRFNDLFGKGYYLNVRGSNILDKEYCYPTYVNNTWADRGTLGDPFGVLVTIGKTF